MGIHEYDKNMAPDADFTPGKLELLSPGNSCRLLDPRRTPGAIEEYFPDSAMFRWRISAFEHKGRFWDLPAEDVSRLQFERGAKRLSAAAVAAIARAIEVHSAPLRIERSEEARRSAEGEIGRARERAVDWLRRESAFFSTGGELDLGSRTGPRPLALDLLRYMASLELREVETRTAENVVLNPRSGEWVKGMEIVLAEMGLIRFDGTVTRTAGVFQGQGDRQTRRAYLVSRLGFVRAYFDVLGVDSVSLYRGVFVDGVRTGPSGSLVSYTFSPEVARSFSEPDARGHVEHPVAIEKSVPVESLLMTYLETEAMNAEYKEAEAIVLESPASGREGAL
jgi:hypothetical protein